MALALLAMSLCVKGADFDADVFASDLRQKRSRGSRLLQMSLQERMLLTRREIDASMH
jgi:hypothetical protein